MNKAKDPYSLERIKRALWHFISGKFISAFGGLATTLFIARELPVNEYGIYALMLGLTVLVGTMTSTAFNNSAQRYIPEFMVKGHGGSAAVRLTWWITGCMTIVLIVVTSIIMSIAPVLAAHLGIGENIVELRIWCGVLIVIILFRYQLVLLETFLMQRATKWLNLLLVFGRLFFLVVVIDQYGILTIQHVIVIEGGAHGIAMLAALAILTYKLTNIDRKDHDDKKYNWALVKRRIFRFGAYNWLNQLTFVISGRAFDKFIIAAYLNPYQVAAFGFAENLNNILLRYMPSRLLRNLLIPVLMADYTKLNNIGKLDEKINTICKLNFFFLSPFIAFFAVAGNQFTSVISKGKYPDAGWMFLVMILMLVVNAYYQIFEIHANATENNNFLFWVGVLNAAFLIPCIPAIKYFGIGGLLSVRLLGQIINNSTLAFWLKLRGAPCVIEYAGSLRLFFALVLTVILIKIILPVEENLLSLCVTALMSLSSFLVIAAFFKPFSEHERQSINALLGRKVFVW